MADINELKGQKLLEGLDEANLKKIADLVDEVQVTKNDSVFKEGDATRGIYMVRKGAVEINKMTPDGWKQKLILIKETHFFGELSVIENKESHGANAEALDDTDLYVINKEKFEEMEKSDPALMAQIMKTIAKVASHNVHLMNNKLINLLISY
jgi:CRP-like cAMP-binding protein